MKAQHRQYWLDRPQNQRRVRAALYGSCAVLFALDFVMHRHAELGVEAMPGFYPVFGFVACVGLVLAAKQMRKFVMRREDYYDVER